MDTNRTQRRKGAKALKKAGGKLIFSAPLRLCVSFFLIFSFACSCSQSGNVKTYPVKGLITFEGKPMVGGGAISLIPTSNQPGKTAAGIIKPDGTYVLGTYTETDGSMAGDFKVIINQETVKEEQAAPDGSRPSAAAAATVPPADRIPLTYANDRQTPLTAKIEPKPNEINFDLKRQ
jgi:hypothetical protein